MMVPFFEDGGAGGAGGASGGGGSGSTPPPGTPPPGSPPATPEWTASLAPELQGFVTTKGFKDPAMVVQSYRDLEKLIGVKDRLIQLPEKDDDKAGWDAVYTRLGRPAKADEYAFEVPQGADPAFANFMKGAFHELGLPKKQGDALAKKYAEHASGTMKAMEDARAAQVETETSGLKTEWGAAYEQELSVAKAGATKFGIDAAMVDKLENVMGFAGTMKFLNGLGKKTGEHGFQGGDGQGGGFNGHYTPAAAQAKIQQLISDKEFGKRYLARESSAVTEMEKLHKYAYPENQS